LRDGVAIAVITLMRNDVRPFTEKQIDLVTTFADQALIAIENTRLFEEVQEKNRALTLANSQLAETLEQQTATSELLKVIGRSTFDLKPVFETLIESAVKLCGATRGFVSRFDGKYLRFEAGYNVTPELTRYFQQHPFTLDRHSNTGRAALERRTVHNIDVRADQEYSYGGKEVDPYRTVLAVPMLKADNLLGVVLIYRHEVLPFTDSQIALMETFADQAVIAIENARLLDELQTRTRELTRSVEELRALGEVGQTVSSTLDLPQVLQTVVEQACTMAYATGGAIYVFDEVKGEFHLEAGHNMSAEHIERVRAQPIRLGDPVVGECAARLAAVQVEDLTKTTSTPLLELLIRAGVRAILAVPLLHQGEVIGALAVRRNEPGAFSAEIVRLLEAFAAQSAIAVNNARLFKEVEEAGRQVAVASQHKSQFVANMSHELRTPIAAILGYAELMQEGFYEPLGQKSLDALTRIRSNGKHLLGLINTVLDIAKIESGQFTLNMAEYALDTVVETVRFATESLAQNKKLALKTEVAKSLPIGLGDEQRLTQVLLNLVGNAIKFTDTGEVCVTAKAVNGHFAVSVMDTGPGIAEQEQARIFEQFHQVDSSLTKAKGGTGLGLAIAKQIVEMHGGRIWVESTPGQGSTFQMELPTRAEFRKRAL
jgi:signal transduction histidine kinase